MTTHLRVHGQWARLTLWIGLLGIAVGVAATMEASVDSPAGASSPSASVNPRPDYLNWCAPTGQDVSAQCLRLALAAIDHARALEGVGPMVLPADFTSLSVPEQLFVAIDRERVDRGLVPFIGLSADLDRSSNAGAVRDTLPRFPGNPYQQAETEWLGESPNGLDADYQWMYDDGPGSGVPDCSTRHRQGCWIDRDEVLNRFPGTKPLVMGAAMVVQLPSRRRDGGSSLSAVFAQADRPVAMVFTWQQALASMKAGSLQPLTRPLPDESLTGIPNPRTNIDPNPDYDNVCAPTGIDSSARCVSSVLAAINHARALEGVVPMVLPSDFDELSIPEQIFVAVDRERVDRGLPPFVGLTVNLDQNAAIGARRANDPPGAGNQYELTDGEWAGGSSNGLDAVYGWMYQDGYNSGNLDCLTRHASGCWGHREGILDDFGTGNLLVMGAALDPTGDTGPDKGGTSMAATLAMSSRPVTNYLYTWSQALADTP